MIHLKTYLRAFCFSFALFTFFLSSHPANCQTLRRNIAQLISYSDDILTGQVIHLQDGFLEAAGGQIPFTEITLQVFQSIKGQHAETFSFRQFGLLEPRTLPNGLVYALTTPTEWPRFETGEHVLLFLIEGSTVSGLRSTVGLTQGKFSVQNGYAVNGSNNGWLFEKVPIQPDQLLPVEQHMFLQHGPISMDVFVPFIQRSIAKAWFEGVR